MYLHIDTESYSSSPENGDQWCAALRDYQLPSGMSEATCCFLEGCRVFLAGFSDLELVKLHKIVNLGGGAR